jgi:3-methyladenine DNA glycosylase AlkD
MSQLNFLRLELKSKANSDKAKILQRFFKTGKGEYGEGDIFLGITVPQQRTIAKSYLSLTFNEIQELLDSKIHEERLIALIILTTKFKKSKKNNLEKIKLYEFYLRNTKNINNWDLVDISAPKIVGEFLLNQDKYILRSLAKSENLWERRIAIISTLPLIKKRSFGETLAISEILLTDKHDLIHKAVGWMLREVGKKNKEVLELFLKTRYKEMPRTMLRYSIEKFPEDLRKKYLNGEI